MPTESRTLGLSHLQLEEMIVAARTSTSLFDFALVAMLGLLGLRVFEACPADRNTDLPPDLPRSSRCQRRSELPR